MEDSGFDSLGREFFSRAFSAALSSATHALPAAMKFEHLYFHGTPTANGRGTGSWVREWRPAKAKVERAASGGEADEAFFEGLMGRAELPVAAYRRRALARRLPACLRMLRVTDVAEATRAIAAQPEATKRLLNVVLLGVTDFFRDRPVFEQLQRGVLPELWARHGRLRVWSAACSNGAELYSVAMLLARAGRLADCELLGTDCRADAIEEARRGVFRGEELARMEQEWREVFFEITGEIGTIDPLLRQATRWKVGNLFGAMERGPWHLILWRNMAIYLENERAEEIWTRLFDQLAPGGFLVAGKADHPPKWLRLTRVAPCIYRKRG